MISVQIPQVSNHTLFNVLSNAKSFMRRVSFNVINIFWIKIFLDTHDLSEAHRFLNVTAILCQKREA